MGEEIVASIRDVTGKPDGRIINVEMSRITEMTNRRHVIVGVVAGVLSVGIHVAGLLSLANVRFRVPLVSRRMLEMRRAKSMMVTDVVREMPAKRARPAVLKPGDAALPADLAEEARILGLSPDGAVIEPPASIEKHLTGEMKNIAKPRAVPRQERWEPRQELMMIEDRIAADTVETLTRKKIPPVERVREAPDIVPSVSREALKGGTWRHMARRVQPVKSGQVTIARMTVGGVEGYESVSGLLVGESEGGYGTALFGEDVSDITGLKGIENLLLAEVSLYTTPRDLKYVYFMIEIKRAGAEALPIIPKDVILVQDCSASIAEQRLYFCREGLFHCLSAIGPDDRFNVVSFRDAPEMCFREWADNRPETIEKAKRFIRGMKSEGNTDIYSSLEDLTSVKHVTGRPVLCLLVTDGRSTTGLTRSSDIIGKFSKLNNGTISVFAMGTVKTANSYLLDLLGWCNRGDSFVVTKGRWDISGSMQKIMREVSRPVLAEVRFHFSASSRCAVYPALPGNLYLDRALVLYGRCPRSTEKIIFQAVGKAGDTTRCDMVFSLELDKMAKHGDRNIRQNWAKQKIYHLIGEYAREPKLKTMKEISGTAKKYRVKIPYEGKF